MDEMDEIEAHEARANAASIRTIPETRLRGGARSWLVEQAEAGEDVYAYTAGPDYQIVIWVRTPWPWEEMRWSPEAWMEHFANGGAK